jgi:polysaccharide biosynthesis/export protein
VRFRRRVVTPLLVCIGFLASAAAFAQTVLEPQPEMPNMRRRPSDAATDVTKEEAESALGRTRPLVPQAGPIDPNRYLLGPGDVLELDLWGPFSRTEVTVVSPEGNLVLPGTGPIQVSGRTLSWTRERILRQVAESFRGVRAEVRLVGLRSFKVYIVGAVKEAGSVEVTPVVRASEAVNGVKVEEGGSKRNIELRRRDGTRQRVDMLLFHQTGSERLDPTLVDGDVVFVPRAKEWIGIVGGVSSPGRFEFAAGDSLSTLIALGGGLLPAAQRDRALLVRFTAPSVRDSIWVDLDQVVIGKTDFPVQDGDQLFVTLNAGFHQLTQAAIFGEVEHPGVYPITLGRDRFSNLIHWSGGFRPFANRSSVVLIREATGLETDPEFERLVRLSRSEMTESEYTKFQTRLAERKNTFRLDWARIQSGGNDVDPLLQQGDVVRVDQLVSTVRVDGQVRRPGFVDYLPGRSLKEYVSLAGGFTERASQNQVSVSRTLTGQVIPARSVGAVQPGDFVWVPERRDVDAWSVFRDVVTVAGQVALLIFTLSR